MLEGLVGQRVVIRRLIGDGRYSDVLGHLVEDGPDELVVRRRDGSLVTVRKTDVHRMKPVPPPPERPTRSQILALEEVAAQGWPAPEQVWLGRWLLRAGGGVTGRANSVLPLGEPDRPLPDALAEIERWYAGRGLQAQVQVPTPARTDLDAELAERGWSAQRPTLVLVGGVEAALDLLPERCDLPTVTLTRTLTLRWREAFCRYRGLPELPPVVEAILTGSPHAAFASLVDGEQTVAIARGAVDRQWLGLTALDVRPQWRRRGLAQHVLRKVFEWATEAGATRGYLQVGENNAPALALYDRLGFAVHHRYHYRVR